MNRIPNSLLTPTRPVSPFFWRVALLCCALLLLISPGRSQKQSAAASTGRQQAPSPATPVLSDVPQMTPEQAAKPGRFSGLRPYAGVADAEYLARKNQATSTFTDVKNPSLLEPQSAVDGAGVMTPGASRNFNGIRESCSYVTPSDMALAVGQTYVLQIVNDCLAVYDKNGNLQSGYPKSMNSFLGVPGNNFSTGVFLTDPRLIFDWVTHRYVFVILWEDFPSSKGYAYIGASAGGDPRGSWHIYKIQVSSTGRCPDFPALGQGAWGDNALGAVAVGFNVFPCNSNGFSGGLVDDQVWFLPKGALYSGSGFGFNFFYNPTWGGVLVDTIQPSNDQTLADKPRAIFGVNSFNIKFGGGQCYNGCNGLVVWAFSNVLQQSGSPGLEFSAVKLSTPSNYSLPPNASQKGGANTIDTGDTRISGQVYYASGDLWATVNTNNGGGGPAVLGWQIHPLLNDNDSRCSGSFTNDCSRITGGSIEQEISYDIGGGQGLNAYYGTIIPDPERNLTMVFNFSGTNYYGSTAYVSNRVTNAPNHWHDSGIFLAGGSAYYSQGRWGDFTGVANDLSSPTSPALWFSGMFTLSDATWGTEIGRNGYSLSNQP